MPRKKIDPPTITITKVANNLQTTAVRNQNIVNAVWAEAVRKTGDIPKVKVCIDLLHETDYGYYDHEDKTIYLNVLLTPRRVVKILLHELCHVRQYHTKRMKDQKIKNRWVTIFENEHYPYSKTEYWSSPWEVEARQAEHMADYIIQNTKNWETLTHRPYWLLEA